MSKIQPIYAALLLDLQMYLSSLLQEKSKPSEIILLVGIRLRRLQ